MNRSLAVFLRGINLGNRRVTADELKRCFVGVGFQRVETFIASGNLVLTDPGVDLSAVELRAERAVASGLGFSADAFVRPLQGDPGVESLCGAEPLVAGEAAGFTPHLIFLKEPLPPDAVAALKALETPDDRFPVLEREVVWLRRGGLSDSTIEPRHLEKALGGVPNTMRKVTTLRRMVAKFGGPAGTG